MASWERDLKDKASEDRKHKVAESEAEEQGFKRNEAIAGLAGLAAAGFAAYEAYEATHATNPEEARKYEIAAGLAGAVAAGAGGYAAYEDVSRRGEQKEQETLGEKKHGWFD
eukprot:TRINITY_DN135_c0_g1_i1.p2 TRINITY_DN135_c0_g1~~TRINITY_DN135_c0_g1_i1.p2  ORF type:complete len:112 (+),score=17.06 TRINITY_DN135_c0_g1_i1:189-524(+)